ncbi:hypothetical protein [Saccharicrinis fermentans]|uniref:Uncharacterized protein n=1 Tax=Saccharicrinis fermentans DSM 9555 = JCM 21142 TaxID=869213 RepID=W7Y794_9BACT|nr:hypothetical protein [Saccharicrinis fermentans]GAF03553.1 hypothetical protein JCM21142_52231 [Saccharicrinis fermentans DSM 9555 = JCM 21142]
MKLQYRPLGYVMEILESIGFAVSYSYDDLVFVENNSILVKFNDEDEKMLYLYFNKDIDADAAYEIEKTIMEAGLDKGYSFINSGKYWVREKEAGKEELEIIFLN